jgi:tRNA modification GTPase
MTSARYDLGISELKELIVKQFIEGDAFSGRNDIVPNARHKWGLEQSYRAVGTARKGLADGLPPEIVVMDLKEAVAFLDGILGLSVKEAVLDEIFSKFCVGK